MMCGRLLVLIFRYELQYIGDCNHKDSSVEVPSKDGNFVFLLVIIFTPHQQISAL